MIRNRIVSKNIQFSRKRNVIRYFSYRNVERNRHDWLLKKEKKERTKQRDIKWSGRSSEERLQWKFHTMSSVEAARAADMEGSFLKLQYTASEAVFQVAYRGTEDLPRPAPSLLHVRALLDSKNVQQNAEFSAGHAVSRTIHV